MADINLGGSVGTTGTAILGRAFVNYATDADHTLTVTEYTNQFLTLTSSGSLTVQHNLIAPLTRGQTFIVQNSTSGGQSIQIQGATGTGVVINNGTTTAVVCDGNSYIPLSPANIIAVDAGQVDFTTQPVINTPNAGTHLELDQDFPAMILDGTYGNGTQAWQGGVWILLSHSLIRVASRDSTIPILRVPLPIGFEPIVNRNMQWDKSGNRIYIYDKAGRVIVVDTTPAVDPSGQYVGGCPGVINVLDLTATAVAGQTFVSFVADTTLQYYWFFILGTTTAYRVQFNGANFTTLTLPHNAGDAIFANSQIWSAGYTGTDHYVSQYSPTGTALHDLLINSTAGGTYLDVGGMAYDATNSIVWTYSNGSTNLVVGVQVSPSVSILHSWSPYLNSAFAQNGLNVLASGQVFAPTFAGNFIYDADGTMASGTGGSINANDFSVAENTRYVYAFAHNAYLTTYDIVFFSNSADGWLLQTTNPIQNVVVHINPFVFLGGAQRWVAGGGETMSIVALEMGQANLNPFGDTASTLSFGPPNALSGIPSVTGKQAVISGPDSGFFLISGLTELGTISTGIVGPFLGFLTISGAANAANNGTFVVQNLGGGPFFTSLHIQNNSGVFPDANSGNITWTYNPEYEIIFEIKGNFGMKFLNFSQVPNITTAHSVRVLTASGTNLELLPYLQQSLTLLLYWDGASPTLSCAPIVSTQEQTYYQGTVDPFEGQPITNLPGDGKFLTSLNDNPSQVIDGTYGRDVTGPLILPLPTSAAPWQSGVWTLTNHSIVRNVSTDPDIPALHIPLLEGFTPLTKSDGYVGRTFQWDQPNNRMYVFDANGPKIYTIDTTPTLDVTKSYIESVPGIINIQDLSVYGPAAFTVGAGVGTYMAFTVDLVNFVYWVFSVSLSNQLTTTLIPFAFPIGDAGGNNSQIINYGPQTDINGPVESFDAMYVKDLGVYVTLLSSNGDAQIALASPGGIPVFITTISSGLFDHVGYMAFDPNATPSPIIWMASNVGTGTVWGFDGGSFIYGPWSPGSAPSGVITVMNNDNILIPLVADNVTEFTNVGASVTTISYPVGFTSNSNFGYAVAHDGYNYLYASNNTNGYLDQAIVGTNDLTDWLFVGGQQQWVNAPSANSVIFQPGGIAGRTTFTDFGKLCAYISSTGFDQIAWTIYCDGVSGVTTIPDGTYTIPPDTTFETTYNSSTGSSQLTFGSGTGDVILNGAAQVTFSNLLSVAVNNLTQPVITTTGIIFELIIDNCLGVTSSNGQSIVAGAGSEINAEIKGVTNILNTIITLDSSSIFNVTLSDSVSAPDNFIVVAAGGNGEIDVISPSVFLGHANYTAVGFTIRNKFLPSTFLTFAPAGTDSLAVFTDFKQLTNYMTSFEVGTPSYLQWVVQCVASSDYGTISIASGVYALPYSLTLVGSQGPTLSFADGTNFTGMIILSIKGLGLVTNNTIQPVWVPTSDATLYVHSSSITNVGSQYFLRVDSGQSFTSMECDGANFGLNAHVAEVMTGGFLDVALLDESVVSATAFNTPVPMATYLEIDNYSPSNFVDPSYYAPAGGGNSVIYFYFSPDPVLVYQPGGANVVNTFNDFNQLCGYITSVNFYGFGPKVNVWTIVVDGSTSGGTPTISAGTYSLPREITFKGIGTPSLTLSPDVIFDPPPSSILFENVVVVVSNTTSPVITVPNGINLDLNVSGVSVLNNTGSKAFVEVSAGGTLTGSVHDFGILINPKVISINGGTGQLGFLNHAQLDGSSVQIVTGTFTAQLDPSAGIDPSYYTVSGFTVQFLFAPDGTVLYNSGSTSNDKNIFSDFGQLCAYTKAVGTLVDAWTIEMLSGGGSPVISPGTYVLPANVTFTTTAGTNSNALTLSDVVFDPPPILFTIDNLAVVCDSSTNPCLHVQASTGPMNFMMRGEFAQVNCTGTKPFISDDDTTLNVSMKDQAFLTGGTPVIHFGATADGFFKMYDQSKIAFLSSLDLTAGAAVTITADSGVTLSSPAPAGITITFVDQAFQMVYTPTTLADWSGTSPTSIGNALDRIAAKITPIP